jgi:hypothetical protein
MSTLTQAPEAPTTAGPAVTDHAIDGTRRWVSLIVTALVLAYAVVEVISLLGRHTAGPQLYGVLVAGLAAAAGIFSLALVASGHRRWLAAAAVLVLWAVVALGGVAGSYAHIVGAPPGDGPVDPRPRPVTAPLIFTALGVVGGGALVYGQRLMPVRSRGR